MVITFNNIVWWEIFNGNFIKIHVLFVFCGASNVFTPLHLKLECHWKTSNGNPPLITCTNKTKFVKQGVCFLRLSAYESSLLQAYPRHDSKPDAKHFVTQWGKYRQCVRIRKPKCQIPHTCWAFITCPKLTEYPCRR